MFYNGPVPGKTCFLSGPLHSKASVLEGQGSSHSKQTGSKRNWTQVGSEFHNWMCPRERERDNESKVGLVSRISQNSPLISEKCDCIMILRKRKFEVVINFLSFTEKIEVTRKELPNALYHHLAAHLCLFSVLLPLIRK